MKPVQTLLSDLKQKDSGTVDYFTDDRIGSKLMAMGVRQGSLLSVVRKAPFGSGLYIKINSSHFIAIRKEEAACIVLT